MAMTRVLFLVGSSVRGGSQISLLRLISHLDPGRFAVMLCCPQGFLADEARRSGLVVHIIDNFTLLGVFKLAKLIRNNGFDVINTVLLKAAMAGALAIKLSGRAPRLAVTVNNAILFPGMPRWRRAVVRQVYHYINSLRPIYLTKSEAVKEELLSLVRVSSRQITAIPNPIIFESLPPLDDRPRIRSELGIKEGEIAIGVIGALVPQKGHRYLMEAGKTIKAQNPNVRFYFVGDGPLRGSLEKLASLGCPGQFTFLGERNDSLHCTLAMDIVVLSSIFEGLPNALIEALALARPVVATTVGGCGEVIENGENGLLVKPADPESLAQGVCWMLNHPGSAVQMGRRGAETVRQRFAINGVVEKIGGILEEAAGKTRRGSEAAAEGNIVLVLISSSDIGGAQTHVEWLAQTDLGEDARLVVACPPGPLLNKLLCQGSEVYALNFSPFAGFRIASIIRAVRPVVIHLHLLGAALYGTMGSWLAAGSHLIYTVHNLVVYPGMSAWKRLAYPFLTRLSARRIDQFIAVSEEIKEFLVNSLGLPPYKVRLIHNGISFAALEKNTSTPGEIRQRIGVPAQYPLIGSVGRITFQKGFDILMESLSALAREFPQLHCVIVGDGDRRDEIEGLIRRFRLQDRVHLPGFQQGVLSWYRAMDIVVFPSRFEGLPITIIEAAYAGKPIVASDVGGIKEILQDEASGLLAPCDDAPALTGQIRRLLLEPSFAAHLGRQARALAVDRFDVRRCSEQTVRVYEEYFNREPAALPFRDTGLLIPRLDSNREKPQ